MLIVCEGETEYLYFKNVRSRYRAQWIEPVPSPRHDPKSIVELAKKKSRDLRGKGLDVQTWVVFDAESRMAQEERGYREGIALAKRLGFHVANSSPCFEYWVLLHYVSIINVDDPKDAERELRKPGRIPGYEKPLLPLDELWDKYLSGGPSKAAAERRKALEEDSEDPRMGRPVTYVDELMDGLAAIAGAR